MTAAKPRRASPSILLAIAAAMVLSACSRGQEFVAAYGDADPSRDAFHVCHGYGCYYRSPARIEPAAWTEIAGQFRGRVRDAADERRRVARVIARFETIVGAQVGTAADDPGAGLFAKDRYQQDCIDEAVNTTTYLRLLAKDGLLRHHRIGEAAWRGNFVDGWPHNTAVLIENGTGASYAVDSWFFANGVEPAIVPLDEWKAGWRAPST
jgi:hypothetical protein